MEKEFEQNLFNIAHDRMYSAVKNYYAWKVLQESINIPAVGKEKAERNVAIINWYGDFLHPLFSSTLKGFVVDLAIFFDPVYKQFENTFSLSKLLNALEARMDPQEFEKLKSEIKRIKDSHGVHISTIKSLRDDVVVHQAITPTGKKIHFEELEELFAAVQEILNLISKHFNNSYTVWEGQDVEVKNDFEIMLDNLERGERVRREEIEQAYQEDLPPTKG